MPLPRRQLLEKIFKEGVESVPKETLENLFKTTKQGKLYRYQYERTPEKWFEEGWTEPKPDMWTSPDSPLGLYWAPTKADLKKFMRESDPDQMPVNLKDYNIIEGLKRPKAIPGIDFLTREFPIPHPTKEGKEIPFKEIVQRKPGNVLVKFGDKYKIFSIAALAAAGLISKDKEAEAAIPKIPRQTRKLLMEKLFGWSPERQALKEEVLPTMEKVFKEHGAGIKRGFLGGSSVTPKVNPTDIDLFLQTKPEFDVKLMREMQKHFHEIPQKEGQTILDVVEMSKRAALGIPEEMKGKLHVAWQGSRPWKDVAKEATEFGRVERGYGKNYRLKRILGVTGAATVGGLLAGEPEEAEAMPFLSIKPTKVLSKFFRGQSSSAGALVGEEFAGKTIKAVHKGVGKKRYIEFTDGTTQDSNTDEVNVLARVAGHGRYERKFERATKQEKEVMATSALEDRLNRPALGTPHYEREHQLFLDKVRAIDPNRVPKTVFVRYPKNDPNAKIVQMREDYAKILEEKGIVTIIGKPQ